MTNLSRRKFLYAGAGAGVAAAAGLGYLTKDYWLPQQKQIITPSPTSTIITESTQPTVTETTMNTTESTTSSKLVDLELQLFHDFYGDGTKQQNEKPITDSVFNVLDETEKRILIGVTGDSDGVYQLETLEENQAYRLEFTDEDKKYRHVSISNNEFYTIDSFQFIADSNKTKVKLGLMNGFLTLPFEREGPSARTPYYYFDRGNGKGWGGHRSYGTHNGTDFMAPKGTPILASAPGIVTGVGYLEKPGNYVIVTHKNGTNTHYCHLNQQLVNTGEKVNRGQVIGKCGSTGDASNIPHLHFMVSRGNPETSWNAAFDPFDDLYSAWTINNEPQYPIPDE